MEIIDDYGLTILNGNTEGDWEGNYTHVDHKSQSVIDYWAVNECGWGDIKYFIIGNNEASDHFPLETTLKSHTSCIQSPTTMVQQWSEEGRRAYTMEMTRRSTPQKEKWNDIRDTMWKATTKRIIKTKRTPSWWDKECYEVRKKVRQIMSMAKSHNQLWNDYRKERQKYKKIIKNKKSLWI